MQSVEYKGKGLKNMSLPSSARSTHLSAPSERLLISSGFHCAVFQKTVTFDNHRYENLELYTVLTVCIAPLTGPICRSIQVHSTAAQSFQSGLHSRSYVKPLGHATSMVQIRIWGFVKLFAGETTFVCST